MKFYGPLNNRLMNVCATMDYFGYYCNGCKREKQSKEYMYDSKSIQLCRDCAETLRKSLDSDTIKRNLE